MKSKVSRVKKKHCRCIKSGPFCNTNWHNVLQCELESTWTWILNALCQIWKKRHSLKMNQKVFQDQILKHFCASHRNYLCYLAFLSMKYCPTDFFSADRRLLHYKIGDCTWQKQVNDKNEQTINSLSVAFPDENQECRPLISRMPTLPLAVWPR